MGLRVYGGSGGIVFLLITFGLGDGDKESPLIRAGLSISWGGAAGGSERGQVCKPKNSWHAAEQKGKSAAMLPDIDNKCVKCSRFLPRDGKELLQ